MAARLIDAALRSREVTDALAVPARNPKTNRPQERVRPGDVSRVAQSREQSTQPAVPLSTLPRARRIVEGT